LDVVGDESWDRAAGNEIRNRAPRHTLRHVRTVPLTAMLAALVDAGRPHQGPTEYPIVS
jgi:hypothetical protein